MNSINCTLYVCNSLVKLRNTCDQTQTSNNTCTLTICENHDVCSTMICLLFSSGSDMGTMWTLLTIRVVIYIYIYIYIYVTYCFIYLLCFLSSVKTSLQTQCMSFLYVLNCIALFCPYFQCVHSLYLRGKYTLKRGLNLKRSVKRILVLITCVIKFWKKIDWENLCITCGYVYITCMLV